MGRARTAVLVVVLLGLVAACASPGEETSTPLRAGPLPRIPGPALDEPLAAAAGDHVVVWGGHGGGRYRAGGWVIDGDRQWRPITGTPAAMHGMIYGGAVWTGDALIVMGMRCDLTDAAYAKQVEENEDANPCEGNPRAAVRVDPPTARATSLPTPEAAARTRQSNGAVASGWDGTRAWFQTGNADYSHRLVGFDPEQSNWSNLAAPKGHDLEQACVVGRRIVGLADPDGVGMAVAPSSGPPAMWSWSDDGGWSRLPSAPLPAVGPSVIRASCAGGAVIGYRCGSAPATAAFDGPRDRWRGLPTVGGCTLGAVGEVGPTLVAIHEGTLLAWSPGHTEWTHPIPGSTEDGGFGAAPSVDRGRLLLVADANQNDGRQTRLRLLDVTP